MHIYKYILLIIGEMCFINTSSIVAKENRDPTHRKILTQRLWTNMNLQRLFNTYNLD